MARRPDPRFASDDVRLGYVSGVHGVRGEVKLFLYNPASDLLAERSAVTLVAPDGRRREVGFALRQGAGRRILAKMQGIEDRDAADALRGYELVLAADQLPRPEPGSWYHRDLLGLPVRTVDGRDLGRITEIHDTGEVDVWLLDGPGGVRVLPVLRDKLVEVRPTAADQPGFVLVTDDAVDDRPPI